MKAMSCDICGDARGCLPCRFGGMVRWYAEHSPAHRARYVELWLADPTPCPEASPVQAPAPALALARVAACPDRGPVLPHSQQPECGCGGELSGCRAGRGRVAGRVTLRECLACVSSRSGALAAP